MLTNHCLIVSFIETEKLLKEEQSRNKDDDNFRACTKGAGPFCPHKKEQRNCKF